MKKGKTVVRICCTKENVFSIKKKKFQLKNKINKITIKYKLAIDVGSCLESQHSGG